MRAETLIRAIWFSVIQSDGSGPVFALCGPRTCPSDWDHPPLALSQAERKGGLVVHLNRVVLSPPTTNGRFAVA